MLESKTKLKIALIIVLCIVTCLLVYGIATNIGWLAGRTYSLFDDLQLDDGEEISQVTRNQEPLSSFAFEADDVHSISIDWAAGAIDVHVVDEAADDGMVHITEYAKGSAKQPSMQASCDSGTLNIDYNARLSIFSGCSFGKKVAIIELPANVAANLDRFELDGASGRYDLSDLNCESMKLHIASGKIDCSESAANSLTLDITSGSVLMAAEVPRQLNINITSGNIDLTCKGEPPQTYNMTMTSGKVNINCLDGIPNKSDIKVTSGSMMLAFPENSGFEANVRRTSGSFSCNLPCEIAGDAYLAGDRSAKLDINLTSGNVELKGIG